MLLRSRKSVSHRRNERGYILTTVVLFVALIAIAAVVMAPTIAFQMKRDREEELIHRGVQYSRAMKHFVKKFGRYPMSIEELQNTNQIRFLRRRYKDPITGKDFKILHMGDVQMAFGAGIAGATPAAALNQAAAAGLAGGGALATKGGLSSLTAGGGLAGGLNPGGPTPGAGTPPGSDTSAGQNPDGSASDTGGSAPTQGQSFAAAGPGPPGSFGAIGQGSSTSGAQVFGGGPMVGVASTSKDKSIRVFNKKDHYYQWQFIYDPSTDTGGLLATPNQPSLQGATAAGTQPGAPGNPGIGGSAIAPGTFGGISGQPGPGAQPVQSTPPGMPQMPPEQGP